MALSGSTQQLASLEGLSAQAVQHIQKDVRNFIDATHEYHTADQGQIQQKLQDLQELLQCSMIWEHVRGVAPELDVRADEVMNDSNHPLSLLQQSLLQYGYLRPSMPVLSLNPVLRCEFERVQDHLFTFFPVEVHVQLHHYIDALYEVQTQFAENMFGNPLKNNHMHFSGLGDSSLGSIYDEDNAAQCDRLFNQLCALWLRYRNKDETIYQTFRQAYMSHRNKQELWVGPVAQFKTQG